MKDFSVNLEPIEGILGQICRERAADYADSDFVLPPVRARKFRFEQALTTGELTLIAEVKRASPSRGFIADRDPVEAALAYERGGAAALSILTEPRHFGGNAQFLKDVVSQAGIPALRKDFVVHPEMVLEASYWGASAVLLMVSVLGNKLEPYLELAHHLGLDALVEVHTEEELDLALNAGARIIGVNNRDLHTLEINLGTAPRVGLLAREYDFDGVLIALSGYSNRAELISLEGVFDAVLIGSSLAGSADIEGSTRALLGR